LRVHPYSDQKTFEEEILRPWRNRHGADPQGFLRLKTLVRAITISRTKAVVQLPSRTDEVHHLDFEPAERETYEAAKMQSCVLLDDAISSGNQRRKTFNALELLNKLRLICSHGLLAQSVIERKEIQIPEDLFGSQPRHNTSEAFHGDLVGGLVACSNCGSDLLEDILDGAPSDGNEKRHHASSCERICERCSSESSWNGLVTPWTYGVQSQSSESHVSPGPATPSEDQDTTPSIDQMSTKIKALVADLFKHNATEKRFDSL
jgi:SWI/SNF-related matrix-associated actin-dependent regulator of chromatin subfamily A3